MSSTGTALLADLEQAGLEIRFLLASVRDEVLAATHRLQQPFVYGSLSRREIYLKPPGIDKVADAGKAQPNSPAAPSSLQSEIEGAWVAVQTNRTIAALEVFTACLPVSTVRQPGAANDGIGRATPGVQASASRP